MRKFLGYLIVLSFIGMFYGATVLERGWWEATAIWLLSLGGAMLLFVGILFIVDDGGWG